ncbi:hypothetical protein VB712_17125 [Spirulina sp. CCNP1310]|uniref:hypothetical protein n=1 Tax=Spirulina sp. CCNP1310 TaxID=3110249 RepID=UPI002B1FAE0B|nr:hypothetical protein [Spirulina sp. CCNP1310]MEA5420951.1 hypothetical protein [Spirulina sp. CCNP1310]
MSLIHLDKSVLTFHFKEILETGQGNHPLAWLGLGVLILGTPLLMGSEGQANAVRSQKTRSPQTPMRLTDWIAQAENSKQEQPLPQVVPVHR